MFGEHILLYADDHWVFLWHITAKSLSGHRLLRVSFSWEVFDPFCVKNPQTFAEKTSSRSLWFHLMFSLLTAQLFSSDLACSVTKKNYYKSNLLLQHLCTELQLLLEKLTSAASSHLNKPFFFFVGQAECLCRYAALPGRSDEARLSEFELNSTDWFYTVKVFQTLCLWSHCIVFPLTLTERIAGMSLHFHRLYFSVCVSFAWMCPCMR